MVSEIISNRILILIVGELNTRNGKEFVKETRKVLQKLTPKMRFLNKKLERLMVLGDKKKDTKKCKGM